MTITAGSKIGSYEILSAVDETISLFGSCVKHEGASAPRVAGGDARNVARGVSPWTTDASPMNQPRQGRQDQKAS